MGQRQLNIRSDEAAGRASTLAKRLGKTTTEVVEEALRQYEDSVVPRDERGLTPEQRKRFDAIMELTAKFSLHTPPDMSSDDSWMYDEYGLPK